MNYTKQIIIFNALLLMANLQALTPSQGQATTVSQIGLNIPGVSSQNTWNSIVVPPDTMGAIGPEQFITFINQGVYSIDKKTGKTDGILSSDNSSFFDAEGIPFDTRIRFDKWSQRWYLIASASTSVPVLLLAVSDGPVITKCTKWKLYELDDATIPEGDGPSVRSGTLQIGQGGKSDGFLDFPLLGIDAKALYISSTYSPPDRNDLEAYTIVYVINKESLLDCDSIVVTAFRDLPDFIFKSPTFTGYVRVTPADNLGNPNPECGYLFDSFDDFLGLAGPDASKIFQLWKVLNPGSLNPVLTDPLTILSSIPHFPSFGIFNIPHKGAIQPVSNSGLIFGASDNYSLIQNDPVTGEERLFYVSEVLCEQDGNSSGYPVNNVDNLDRTGIQWVEFKNIQTTPEEVQIGTIFDPAEIDFRYYFIPSYMVNKHGYMTINCATSANNEYINASTFARKYSDLLGALGPENRIVQSNHSYNFQYSGGQRWGDYTYTSLDPCNETDMWTIQQWVPDTDQWGMKITQLKPGN